MGQLVVRRFIVTLTIATSVVVAVVAVAPAGAARDCRVRNATTLTRYVGTGGNLQRAIDEASSGDTLKIRGVCVGRFTIAAVDRSFELFLLGVPTDRAPAPTLDAAGHGAVLRIRRATAGITGLTITGGHAWGWGGGIRATNASVTLAGATRVTRNYAQHAAGGVYNNDGTLTVTGSVVLRGNRTDGWGAGIRASREATTVLGASAKVVRNEARRGGGFAGHSLVLHDRASVVFNRARHGGGIYLVPGGEVHVCSLEVKITPNTPNDPPPALPCP